MKNFKYIVGTFIVAISAFNAQAQNSVSSYFLDGSFYNYKMNPAMKAERPFFSIALGNLSLGTKGNIGITDFIYPYGDDKLTTFMSGTVDKDMFLSKLPQNMRVNVGLNENIFTGGFRMLGGYTTIDLSINSSTSIMLPKGLFEFAKKGLAESAYSFSGLAVNSLEYAAFTIGHSREVYKGLRVGANLKYIAGLAHANVMVNKLNVELNDQHWMAESYATAQAALYCDADVLVDEEGVINNFEIGKIGAPAASGFGVDLGVEYDMDAFVPGLTVSASIVDLGQIYWKHMMKANSTDARVEFNGFNEFDYNTAETTFNDELNRLADDASKLVEFNYAGKANGATTLDAKMYLGAEYEMPFYKPLSVGVMYNHNFSTFDVNKWYQVRGYVNIAPTKWVSASVNYGYSTFGQAFGWMLNFHPAGFNFFIGSDFMITKVTPQYIPLNDLNAHVNIGISIAVGPRK